jgi:hypothetical protein
MGQETLDASLEKASCPGWPRRRCHSGDDAWATKECAGGRWSGYRGPELLHLTISLSVMEEPSQNNQRDQTQ